MSSILEIIETKAKELISLHTSNNNISHGWKFAYNKRTCHIGLCSYEKKTIFLSRQWAEFLGLERIIDTILHEIAHAMTQGDGHGSKWKRACVMIGANPSRTASDITPEEINRFNIANRSKYAIIHHLEDGNVEFICEMKRIGKSLYGSKLRDRPESTGRLYYVEYRHIGKPDVMQYAFKASNKDMEKY